MDFFLGLVTGWATTPYLFYGFLLFFSGFPIFFWGYDIYENDRWRYRFWRTLLFMVLTGAVLHFFTPFEAAWLITGDLWSSALNLWLYALGYIFVGYLYSNIRFYFYAREYNK